MEEVGTADGGKESILTKHSKMRPRTSFGRLVMVVGWCFAVGVEVVVRSVSKVSGCTYMRMKRAYQWRTEQYFLELQPHPPLSLTPQPWQPSLREL